ncbi:MAG: polymer-forming cytoskeletal protein [Opitutales bacterium]|nr:polymer-forming cytoskeletal protein [Opitutales bacterium]
MTELNKSTDSYKNILSSDVSIVGSLTFSNDLVIDGKIEGEVNSTGNLTVGDNASIKGEIHTKSVTVYGNIEGNVSVEERCVLKATSNIQGDITAATISIEEGSCFSGRSSVGAPQKKEEPKVVGASKLEPAVKKEKDDGTPKQ